MATLKEIELREYSEFITTEIMKDFSSIISFAACKRIADYAIFNYKRGNLLGTSQLEMLAEYESRKK